MRIFIASIASVTLLVSGAMAAGTSGPLAPGKPAGVRQAQEGNGTALIVIAGIVATGLAIGLATSSSGTPGGPVALTTTPGTTVLP